MTWAAIHDPSILDWEDRIPLSPLLPAHVNSLRKRGISDEAIMKPRPLWVATGFLGEDGGFVHDPAGPEWLAFAECSNVFYWRKSGEFAWEWNTGFAIGEDIINNPWLLARRQYLQVFADPIDYLLARRVGICIVRWDRTYAYLHDCRAEIAVAPKIRQTFDRAFQPPPLPRVSVLPSSSATELAI